MIATELFKYYKVYLNGTSVTEVSANDFTPNPNRHFKNGWVTGGKINEFSSVPSHFYSLPAAENMYYGYTDKPMAMRKAKAGALKYINAITAEIKGSIAKLKKYREDHFEDLNDTLLDQNIRNVEREMGIK